MGRHRSRAWGKNATRGKARGHIARGTPTRRLRVEALEQRRLLDGVGASNDLWSDIGFSGTAGILTPPPATLDLLAVSDTGISSIDNLTNLDNSKPDKRLQFAVGNTIAGATVIVYADGTIIGYTVATGTETTVATNGTVDMADGWHAITARQILPDRVRSDATAALGITIDTVAPDTTLVPLGDFNTSGDAQSVVVAGTLAYVADKGAGLQIVDIATPAAPKLLGSLDTSGEASGVALSGTLAYVAYVADGSGGVAVIDVANPAAPTQVRQVALDGPARGVTVAGTRLYVADDTYGLKIFDIATPDAPVLLGTFDTAGSARAVVVSGVVAYVADNTQGLQIIDVTNPAEPVRIGGFITNGTALGLAIDGTTVYMADGSRGLQIFDVTNPAAPVRLRNYPVSAVGAANGVAIAGTRAYIAEGLVGLEVIDITNAAAPAWVGTHATQGAANGVAVSGTRAYVAQGLQGLRTFEVTPPQLPAPYLQPGSDTGFSNSDNITSDTTPTFNLAVPAGSRFRFYRDGVQISGSYETAGTYATIYTPAAQDDGTYAYTVALVDTAGNLTPQSLAVSVTIDSSIPSALDLAAAADTGKSSADDLTNLDNSLPGKTLQFTVGNTVAGALVSVYADNVQIGSSAATGATTTVVTNGTFDLVDGAHTITARQTVPGKSQSHDSAAITVTIDTVAPLANGAVQRGTLDTSGSAWAVTVAGTLAYVADGAAGLLIVDVSDPAAPVQRGVLDTSGTAYGVTVVGTLAYVADGAAGLVIVDVSNPAAPVQRGVLDTSGAAWSVAISGTVAYVADGGAGLAIVNVANPAAPVLLRRYTTAGPTHSVAVVGTLAYVAVWEKGLEIVDVTDPAAPARLGLIDTAGKARAVAVSGTTAYVADDTAGLVIFDVADPAAPVRLGAYNAVGNASGVAIAGPLAYVAYGSAGLVVVDVSNPAVPVRLTGCSMGGVAGGVAVSGTLAYIADGAAGLVITELVPSPPPDLQATSDTGSSNTDNITDDTTPTFDLTVPAGAYFRFYRDGTQLGDGYQTGTTYTATAQTDGTYGYSVAAVDEAGNLSAPSLALPVTIDATPPTILASTVNGGAAQRSRITSLAIRFSEDISASLDSGDLKLVRDGSTTQVDLSAVTPTFDPASHTATWNVSGIALEDGYYTATLSAAGITDAVQLHLASGDYSFRFFRLLGDTDGSAAVDIFDIGNLQVNFGRTSGMTASDGDLDGNGAVDIFDAALAQVQFGKTLTPPAPAPAGAPSALSTRRVPGRPTWESAVDRALELDDQPWEWGHSTLSHGSHARRLRRAAQK
ncbi:MAG: Ig-like domain-containing protein [Pirellulales bacterium]